MTIKKEFQPADIVGTRTKAPASSLIRFATTNFLHGESYSEISHVGEITRGGVTNPGITEARALHRVAENDFYKHYSGRDYYVARPVFLHSYDRALIAQKARSFHGMPYTERVLFWQLLGLDRILARYYGDRWIICSWVVARSYKEAGMHFGIDYRQATPDDIDDYIKIHYGTKFLYVVPPTWDDDWRHKIMIAKEDAIFEGEKGIWMPSGEHQLVTL